MICGCAMSLIKNTCKCTCGCFFVLLLSGSTFEFQFSFLLMHPNLTVVFHMMLNREEKIKGKQR